MVINGGFLELAISMEKWSNEQQFGVFWSSNMAFARSRGWRVNDRLACCGYYKTLEIATKTCEILTWNAPQGHRVYVEHVKSAADAARYTMVNGLEDPEWYQDFVV